MRPIPLLPIAVIAAASALTACGPSPVAGSPAPTRPAALAYVLSVPDSVNGDPIVTDPTGAATQQMSTALGKAMSDTGVTGATVRGLYDDAADDAWLVVLGVNGRGFTPRRMLTVYGAAPQERIDGTGDHVTVSGEPGTAGPHGGSAICQQILLESGGLAVEQSACYWLTPTTFGLITLYPKHDGDQWGFGWPATKIDALMGTVRPEVEHQA